MSKKGAAVLQDEVPWRASSAAKLVLKIHHSPVLCVPQTSYSNYVMKHPDPIGNGLGMEGVEEIAGQDCIVPGQVAPIKLLGLKGICNPLESNLLESNLYRPRSVTPFSLVLEEMSKCIMLEELANFTTAFEHELGKKSISCSSGVAEIG